MAAAMQPDPVPTSTTSGRRPGSAVGAAPAPTPPASPSRGREPHARGKPDAHVEKILPAAESAAAARAPPGGARRRGSGRQASIQRAIEAQHDVAPAAGQQIGQQPLGVDARCVDARRAQGRGSLVERRRGWSSARRLLQALGFLGHRQRLDQLVDLAFQHLAAAGAA
jgi:hypothetical protein